MDFNVGDDTKSYKKKRDSIYRGLKEKFQVQKPRGAFYIFPEVPRENAEAFVEKAIQQSFFIVSGNVFSKRDTLQDLICCIR